MNDSGSNLLSQLRDIHGTTDPGWWPPAVGWWLLGLLALALTIWLLRFAGRRWLIARRRRKLLSALNALAASVDPADQPHEYLSRLNRLFRVVALRAFPGTACARLQGAEWVHFIQSLLPQSVRAEGLSALASGPYEPMPEFDARELQELARIWVGKYG